ncbi:MULTISPECIES: three component ABC system middle component [Methylobacterium]|uniref:three component ABC system middle component n=1 Tax=Methylobacterium TaxID=407 RepID=UPI0011C80391|nr:MULTISPECIES: three component ABC system middle component [Methylobacterium]TXN42302.1 hypothetical protein FV233_23300 [Methylobacterium sp. WL7]
MQPWVKRAVEEANLFNPAFCATLLTKAVVDFGKKSGGRPMPFALAFLVLPITMHRATRQALPGSTITSMLPWLQEHREQLVDFPGRVKRLKPFSQEAIMFAIANGALAVEEGGGLVAGKNKVSTTEKKTEFFTAEARECVDRAGFLGRWLSTAGASVTIIAAWSIAL